MDMDLVNIKDEYINCLFEKDSRVCFNKNERRPYFGPVFEANGFEYFVPLSSSSNGEKLAEKPRVESEIFLPIDECQHGGIKFNNMLPVVSGVCKKINIEPNEQDRKGLQNYKNLLRIQMSFITEHQDEIKKIASALYEHKINNELKRKEKRETCSFPTLERVATKYEYNAKNGLPQQSLIAEYRLTQELYAPIYKYALNHKIPVEVSIRKVIVKSKTNNYNPGIKAKILEENEMMKELGMNLKQLNSCKRYAKIKNLPLKKVIRSNIAFSPDGKYKPEIKAKLIDEIETARHRPKVNQQNSTREKINNQQPVATKPKRKDSDQNSR